MQAQTQTAKALLQASVLSFNKPDIIVFTVRLIEVAKRTLWGGYINTYLSFVHLNTNYDILFILN